MKSALFVDFDNVYSGLRRLDLAYAEAFATDPMRWMNWISTQLQIPLEPDAPVKRRILVRRCYLNPVMYQRFRFGFSKAGFEIVDCPPMTSAGKTSTDIHMVLDIVDVLQSETRYDEFIVFSADADFTPVLRKLRRDDRRTTIFAAGATSSSYDASSDLIIDPQAFIEQALGLSEDEHTSAHRPDIEGLLAQAEALTWEVVDKASAPVPLPALTKILATQVPGLTDSNWAGCGTFTALLRELPLSPLRIDRENNWLIDPRRVKGETGGTPSGALAPSDKVDEPLRGAPLSADQAPTQTDESTSPHAAPTATASDVSTKPDAAKSPADTRRQIESILSAAVAASPRPVAVARLAHQVRLQCPGIEADWLGCGTFKRLLDTVHPVGVQISWQHLAGYAYDPARHSLDFISPAADTARDQPELDPRWPQVAPILQVARFPTMAGYRYRAFLEALSTALAEGPYALSTTTARVRDICLDRRVPMARSDISALLRALLFNGFDPASAPSSFDELVATTCGVALAACAREGLSVDSADREALLSWVMSEVPSR
jgi:hypothetical protein